MDVRTAYCSACDQNVRVVLGADFEPVVINGDDPHALVCLEYGEKCTGDMCPLFQVPTERMRTRLARLLSAHATDPAIADATAPATGPATAPEGS